MLKCRAGEIGVAGTIYGATALICGTILITFAFRLSRAPGADRQGAYRLFAFSIAYVCLLFAVLSADHSDNPLFSKLPSRGAGTDTQSVEAHPCQGVVPII